MLYFFISKMLGVDLSLRASTPTFIIEPKKIVWELFLWSNSSDFLGTFWCKYAVQKSRLK